LGEVDNLYATLLSMNRLCYVLRLMDIFQQRLTSVRKPFGFLFMDAVYY